MLHLVERHTFHHITRYSRYRQESALSDVMDMAQTTFTTSFVCSSAVAGDKFGISVLSSISPHIGHNKKPGHLVSFPCHFKPEISFWTKDYISRSPTPHNGCRKGNQEQEDHKLPQAISWSRVLPLSAGRENRLRKVQQIRCLEEQSSAQTSRFWFFMLSCETRHISFRPVALGYFDPPNLDSHCWMCILRLQRVTVTSLVYEAFGRSSVEEL